MIFVRLQNNCVNLYTYLCIIVFSLFSRLHHINIAYRNIHNLLNARQVGRILSSKDNEAVNKEKSTILLTSNYERSLGIICVLATYATSAAGQAHGLRQLSKIQLTQCRTAPAWRLPALADQRIGKVEIRITLYAQSSGIWWTKQSSFHCPC